ncbi:hypothetical protein EG329_006726 [Mollisiaceae sp. DMI_Dod_QoI]|nr:hypothetical protein EG329_006726 [Helotiales sp. DMI_Dod_QoI]
MAPRILDLFHRQRRSPRHLRIAARVHPFQERTFTKFASLPTELRLKIWHYALALFGRQFRILPYLEDLPSRNTISKFFASLRGAHRQEERVTKWLVNPGNIPKLLCVNREARYELMKYYYLVFNLSMTVLPHGLQMPGGMRVCPGVDTLLFEFPNLERDSPWPLEAWARLFPLIPKLFEPEACEKLEEDMRKCVENSVDERRFLQGVTGIIILRQEWGAEG